MSKYSVVTTRMNCRSYAEGAKEYTLDEAVKVAKRTHRHYQTRDMACKIEIILVKDNGQHGDTVAEYYAIPYDFAK